MGNKISTQPIKNSAHKAILSKNILNEEKSSVGSFLLDNMNKLNLLSLKTKKESPSTIVDKEPKGGTQSGGNNKIRINDVHEILGMKKGLGTKFNIKETSAKFKVDEKTLQDILSVVNIYETTGNSSDRGIYGSWASSENVMKRKKEVVEEKIIKDKIEETKKDKIPERTEAPLFYKE